MLWALAIVAAALFAVFLAAAVAGNRAQDRLVDEQRRREREAPSPEGPKP